MFMGNDHALEITSISITKLKMYDGLIRTIWKVRHVKGFKKNLLSLWQLDGLCCKTCVEYVIMKIIKGAFLMLKARTIIANLFMLMGET